MRSPDLRAHHHPTVSLPGLRIDASADADGCLIRLVGELDLVAADDARDWLVTLPERFPDSPGGRHVTLDVADLRFVDAAGVRALYEAQCRLGDVRGHLRIRGARPLLRTIVAIAGLADALDFSASPPPE